MPDKDYVQLLQQLAEGPAYVDTAALPASANTFVEHARYGNWSGSAYSAGGFAPGFNNPDPGEAAPPSAVGAVDAFDAVSRDHDRAYELAEVRLERDLLDSGVSADTAFHRYYSALAEADERFMDEVWQLLEEGSSDLPASNWGMAVLASAMTLAFPATLQANRDAAADFANGTPGVLPPLLYSAQEREWAKKLDHFADLVDDEIIGSSGWETFQQLRQEVDDITPSIDPDLILLGRGPHAVVPQGTDPDDFINDNSATRPPDAESELLFDALGDPLQLAIFQGLGLIPNSYGDVSGTAAADVLMGTKQHDEADPFTPGAGNDLVVGGGGGDRVSYAAAPGPVEVDLTGAPSALWQVENDGYGFKDTLVAIEAITGSGDGDYFRDDRAKDPYDSSGSGGIYALFGGPGIDTIDYSSAAQGVTVDLPDSRVSDLDDGRAGELFSFENVVGTGFGDVIKGAGGANLLQGGAGADSLSGGSGRDVLAGGVGNDSLSGNGGDDTLSGGSGNDKLKGAGGDDIFLFDAALDASKNRDRVIDYSVPDDTIHLDNAVFSVLGLGPLGASAFRQGAAAADSSDRIIYDGSSGALFYDPDGTGGDAAVQFATLPLDLALDHQEFFVV
jgi:hypothetical protein